MALLKKRAKIAMLYEQDSKNNYDKRNMIYLNKIAKKL